MRPARIRYWTAKSSNPQRGGLQVQVSPDGDATKVVLAVLDDEDNPRLYVQMDKKTWEDVKANAVSGLVESGVRIAGKGIVASILRGGK